MSGIDISPEAVDDLVKRLREIITTSFCNTANQAADRIEALSAALTQSQDLVDRWINTSAEQHQTIVEMLEALEQSREECANLAAWQCVYTDGKTGIVCDEYGNQFCQQSRDLTQSRAETAAAYELAAKLFDDGTSVTGAAIGRCIRALATADQTAALDKLIVEAVKPWADMAQECIALTQHPETTWDLPARLVRRMNDAILAASKKGGA